MIKNAILGAVVGDVIGVPYEFKLRSQIKEVDLISDERRGLPEGTWSDDSSMIFCTMESIISRGRIDIKDIGDTYVKWYNEGRWTPYGRVFDVGNTTRWALENIIAGKYNSGLDGEMDCGNGSLMRVLPIAIKIKDYNLKDRLKTIEEYSAITHSHIKCRIACNIYSELIVHILKGNNKEDALSCAIENVKEYSDKYLKDFQHLFGEEFYKSDYNNLSGSGYVIDTLSSSLWIIMNTDNYYDSIIKAIKLGEDTDTTACVVGGITGLLYNDIPQCWIDELARKNDILELIDGFDYNIKKLHPRPIGITGV